MGILISRKINVWVTKYGNAGGGGRNFRVMGSFQTGFGGVGTAFPSAATFPHYAIQQGIPYNVYGYDLYIYTHTHVYLHDIRN